MSYDPTLKELLQGTPRRLLEMLTGSQPAELLSVEFPAVQMRRPDLVVRLADGRLCHIELQSGPDAQMPWRMLEYYYLLARRFEQEPLQHVLYVGTGTGNLECKIEHQALQFRYAVVDLRDLDGEALLASDSLEDNLLGVLCRLRDPREGLRRVLERVAKLGEKRSRDALTKLVILCKLRGYRALLEEEEKKMPIPIPPDILDDAWLKPLVLQREKAAEAQGEARGEIRGQVLLLRKQLEKRFGPLPDWAVARLEAADRPRLEEWGSRLLDAATLEETLAS